VTSLVGDVASVTASVHAALGGVSAGSSARSTRSRARLNRCGGDGWCGVSGRRACLLDRSSSRSASGEDLRSRTLSRIVRFSSPHAEVDSSVLHVVNTRDLDCLCGESVATTRDLDLSAAIVELGLPIVCAVETDVFSTDEVLAIGNALRNLEGHTVLLPGAPSIRLGVATGVADGLLENFKPFTRAIVAADAGRCLGHVDLSGACQVTSQLLSHVH
jgi:hypothetical protein